MQPRQAIKDASSLAQLIRSRRLEVGMRQETLSSLTGISQPNLSKVERGAVGTQLDTYLRILSALGIDLIAEVRS